MNDGFFLQSVVVDDRSVQISYFLEEDRDDDGLLVRTIALNPVRFETEVEELFDAAYQLVAAWEGARRQTAVPAPRATSQRRED